ncbi:DHA2 family efflux MFS transporter permease subunit [Streptomyces albiaxialis]|uniref:DHA2 family efflux MFS transporter permease subunit n=2 Tax=Streptomyces albiaxialis TaxID=329523 RepID=A0ABP5HP79_9ACTN
MFLVVLDATIVSVALPAIGAELGLAGGALGWVVNAYTLTFAGFLLLGGRLADLYGTRAVLVSGLAVFTLANLWSGAAGDPAQLVVARAVQGVGGALLMPATLTVVHQAYADPVRRTRALGLWSMVGAVGAAAGTVAGGILTDALGWRWVFWVKVPVGLAVALGGWAVLPRRAPGAGSGPRRPVDVVGALLVTAGLAALVYGVVTVRTPGALGTALGALAGAVVLLAVFVLHQGRWTRSPLMPLRIFTYRAVSSANVVIFGLGVAYLASPVLLALYLQRILRYSPTQAGFAFLPAAFAVMLGAQAAGRLTPRWGPRRAAVAGTAVTAAGFLWLALADAHSAFVPDIALPSVVFGLGAGFTFTPLTVAATGGVDPSLTGLASGLLNTTRQVATALGIALLSTLADGVGGAGGYQLAFLVSGATVALSSLTALLWMPRHTGSA